MFERLILLLISIMEAITKELIRAYNETFGDKNFTHECYEEINKRLEVNKDLFIRRAAGFVGKKILEEQGYLIPPQQAMRIGEAMFDGAKNVGLIDIMNNVIE